MTDNSIGIWIASDYNEDDLEEEHEMNDEIECPECDGCGEVPTYSSDPASPCEPCLACQGKGWREMTGDEEADAAEEQHRLMFEGEPPLSFSERTAMQVRREAERGVK